MNVPTLLKGSHEASDLLSTPEQPEKVKRRLMDLKTATTFLIVLLISGCVYHRRGARGPHLLEYDHKDAEVVFPWKTTNSFHEEYDLAILASITGVFAYPIEFLEAFARMKIQKIVYLVPTIFYAFENDERDVEHATKNAREIREEQERQRDITSNTAHR